MSRSALEGVIAENERLLIDTTGLIAYFDGREAISGLAAEIIDHFVRRGRNPAVVSMVSVMETLVRPLRTGAQQPYVHFLDFLTRFPNLTALPADIHVAQEAAGLRATHNLSHADALIVATGIVAQVSHIVTNDERWAQKLQPLARRISVLYLNRYV